MRPALARQWPEPLALLVMKCSSGTVKRYFWHPQLGRSWTGDPSSGVSRLPSPVCPAPTAQPRLRPSIAHWAQGGTIRDPSSMTASKPGVVVTQALAADSWLSTRTLLVHIDKLTVWRLSRWWGERRRVGHGGGGLALGGAAHRRDPRRRPTTRLRRRPASARVRLRPHQHRGRNYRRRGRPSRDHQAGRGAARWPPR